MKQIQKKVEELKKKYESQLENIYKIADENDPLRVKAKLITCKNCESKLAKNYIEKTGYFCKCPVCGASLYSNTAIQRMKKAKEKARKIKKEINLLRLEAAHVPSKSSLQDAIDSIYETLEVIYERIDTPDFVEFRGETGGDVRCLRAYKDGNIYEK